jgi:hypothetical protein
MRGCERHGWVMNREAEMSFWEKRHRRQSREGSGEEAGRDRVSNERASESNIRSWTLSLERFLL